MDKNKRVILLVEDDPMVLGALQLVAESWGLQVLVARNADEACHLLRECAPDVVLTDLHLPGGATGYDVAERINAALGRVVPTIILTGETSSVPLAGGQDRGLSMLYKPIRAEHLHKAIMDKLDGVCV